MCPPNSASACRVGMHRMHCQRLTDGQQDEQKTGEKEAIVKRQVGTGGKTFEIATEKATSVSTVVTQINSWLLRSAGGIQSTPHETATIRNNGRKIRNM